MEIWFILSIAAFLSYAISTAIDKYMMDHHFALVRTSAFKMFFDGMVILVIGSLFFNLVFNPLTIALSLLLSIVFAFSMVYYYRTIRMKDVDEIIPFSSAGQILLTFSLAVIVFNESIIKINILGLVLILMGIYSILSSDGIKIPKINKAFYLVITSILLGTIYALLLKTILNYTEPVTLGIVTYFWTAIILYVYNRRKNVKIYEHRKKLKVIFVSAIFGGTGTMLLYLALSMGEASKIFPIGGLHSVFLLIIALLFLKEKFYWHRLLGILAVVAGVYLISL